MLHLVSHPSHVAVGPDEDGGGSGDFANHWKLPLAFVLSIQQLNAICSSCDVEGAGFTHIEKHRPGFV